MVCSSRRTLGAQISLLPALMVYAALTSSLTSVALPLERTPEAFAAVIDRSKMGHVVVVMDEEARRVEAARARGETEIS